MSRVRILLADDHRGLLDKVVRVLEPEFEVVGTVVDGKALLEAVAILRPDVVVLDISMPGLDGFEAAGQLKKASVQVKIVFLTVHNDPEFVRRAFKVGGSGYVVKSRLLSELPVAIRAALAGHSFISPSVSLEDAH